MHKRKETTIMAWWKQTTDSVKGYFRRNFIRLLFFLGLITFYCGCSGIESSLTGNGLIAGVLVSMIGVLLMVPMYFRLRR